MRRPLASLTMFNLPFGRLFLLRALGFLAILAVFIVNIPSPALPRLINITKGIGSFDSIQNATLGFEKILVIHLAERSDKRDALALSASLTGLDLTYVHSVRGSQVIEAARPFNHQAHHLYENAWGSWRGHMTAVRTVLEKNLSSALILEDDIDWDVNLKRQLRAFAVGSRWLTSTSPPSPAHNFDKEKAFSNSTHNLSLLYNDPAISSPYSTSSPYGQNWDILWLGHCGEGTRADDPRLFTILNDPTVPKFSHFINHFGRGFDPAVAPEHTRFVHASNLPVCTFAYAISYAGAQKLLYFASVGGLLPNPFDVALGEMCRHKTLGLECVSVNPALFMNFQKRGPKGFDSDSTPGGENGEKRKKDNVDNIVFSVRLNAERLLSGKAAEAQTWEEVKQQDDLIVGNPYDMGSPLPKEMLDGFT